MRLLLYDRGWKVSIALIVCHRDCCTNRNCRCPCCCVARHHHCEITIRMLLLCAITDATLLSCCNSYCVVPSRILRYHGYRSVCHCIPVIVIVVVITALSGRIGCHACTLFYYPDHWGYFLHSGTRVAGRLREVVVVVVVPPTIETCTRPPGSCAMTWGGRCPYRYSYPT